MEEKKTLSSRFTLRLSESERERILQDASLSGLSASEIIRRRYVGSPIIARTDIIVVRELRRIGGLLKNNFSTLREAGAKAETLAMQEAALTKLISLIEDIGRAYDCKKN